MRYVLENDTLRVEIDSFGAELKSVKRKSDDKEYMWYADKKYWGRTSPVLFPFVGNCRNKEYRYGGKTYAIGQHGFARDMEHTMESRTEDTIWFSLHSNEETMEKYPFAFVLKIGYNLTGNELKVMWKVENPDTKTLYFSIGAHPAFLCPINGEQDKTGYRLRFGDLTDKLHHHGNTPYGMAVLADEELDQAGKAQALLEELTSSQLTGAMLEGSGLSATRLIALMRKDFGLSASFSVEEARLVLGVQYEIRSRNLARTDPYVLAEHFGVDALRFFLMRTFPFGSDGNFSNELLIQTINTDLANDLGNLVSRTTAMVEKYFGGTLPTERENSDADCDLKTMASTLRDRYEAEMEHFQFQNALEQVFKTIQRANKYIDENAPWTLAKDPANRARLATVMYNLLETIRICAVLLTPFIPDSAEKIFDQIGACPCCRTWEKANVWGSLRPDVTVHKGEALFPRIDAEKALAELNAIQEAQRKAALPALELEPYTQENVDFDTFCKSDFRAVKIKNCEAVKKSDKLLKFTLDDGSGTDRTIVSGIRHYYQPEQLIGKTAVAVLNLPPRKMMGQESNGMLLSAVHKEKGEEKLHLLLLDDSIPAGAKLC